MINWIVIHRFSRPVVHAEVDASQELTLEGLMNHLQEAAISHADAAGFGSKHVSEGNAAWLLHRAGIEIFRMPSVGETTAIATWITSSSGPRARRSFEVSVAGGLVARASYVWVYFDVARKMPRRIDAEMGAAFQPEGGDPLVARVDELPKIAIAEASFATDISIRSTDFDSNRHVNNSIYATFVQTLLHHRGEGRPVGRFAIAYQREIGRDVKSVTGRLEDADGGCRFTIETPGIVHAFGEVKWRG